VAKPADSCGWTDKSVLVTVGAGFIGSHLVELLTQASARLTVFGTLVLGERENLAGVVDDATLWEALARVGHGPVCADEHQAHRRVARRGRGVVEVAGAELLGAV
jgi:nucleoside-diphosphate-sugar epimerase